MKNILIIATVLIVLGAGVFFFLRGTQKANGCTTDTATKPSSSQTATSSAETIQDITVNYENGKFSPDCVLIKAGSSVIWSNKSQDNIQIAADPHPIHTGNKEVSDGQFTLDIAPGETQTVTINKIGNSGYHNHLNPSTKGTIIVE